MTVNSLVTITAIIAAAVVLSVLIICVTAYKNNRNP